MLLHNNLVILLHRNLENVTAQQFWNYLQKFWIVTGWPSNIEILFEMFIDMFIYSYLEILLHDR